VPDVTGYRAEDTMSPAYYLSLYRDLEEAFSQETLDEAVKAYPSDREIGFLKIRYMLDHKQVVRAESELRSLVSRGSTDLRVYRELARIYAEEGLIGKAADMYDRAYRLNPRSEEIIRDYIDVLIKQKNYPKALHIAEKGRHEIPNSPVPRIAQGNVFLALKEYGKALPAFLGVMNNDPGNAVGKNLFQVYRGLDDTKNGIMAGEALLKTKGIDAQSVLELARMYARENDSEKAGELLLRALRMDPYNRDIAEELTRTGR
jgi:tetratricopeptide (TPR) repeat protein